MLSDLLHDFVIFVLLQGFAYVPRDDLVSLVANEFRMQLSRALAVSLLILYFTSSFWYFFCCIVLLFNVTNV